MKHALRFIFAFCITAIIIAVACKKKSTYVAPTQSLNQVFAGLRSIPQDFSVIAGRDTILYGSNGTRLHFYANSFKDKKGNIIPNGLPIYIELVEMNKPGDMICNRATTVTTDGQLLQSGGEINITATYMGGAPNSVSINKYGIGFRQTSTSTQIMELYYGNNANSDSVTNWTPNNSINLFGTVATGTINDSATGYHNIYLYDPYYFFDSCTQTGSVNCDYFLSDTGILVRTDVHLITPDNTYNPSNTMVFLVIPATKTNVIMGTYDVTTHTFSISEGIYGIPIGWKYELVVITNKNGNYSYFQSSGVITNGITINAAMAPDTQADVIARLAGL